MSLKTTSVILVILFFSNPILAQSIPVSLPADGWRVVERLIGKPYKSQKKSQPKPTAKTNHVVRLNVVFSGDVVTMLNKMIEGKAESISDLNVFKELKVDVETCEGIGSNMEEYHCSDKVSVTYPAVYNLNPDIRRTFFQNSRANVEQFLIDYTEAAFAAYVQIKLQSLVDPALEQLLAENQFEFSLFLSNTKNKVNYFLEASKDIQHDYLLSLKTHIR